MSIIIRLGLLGGTFNPVHTGHLLMAQAAMDHFELDQVLFIPCATPAHKQHTRVEEARHRLAMLDAALEDNPRFELSRCEIDRGGISYTIDTLEAISREYPDAALFFIIGGDTLFELHAWKRIREILRNYSVVTVMRPGYDAENLMANELKLEEDLSKTLIEHIVTGHSINLSSTDIRGRVAEGMSIKYLTPASVEMYIVEHNLYTT